MQLPSPIDIEHAVAAALGEDLGSGDITAELIPLSRQDKAELICREPAVLCGTAWVDATFHQLNPDLSIDWLVADGDQLTANQRVFTIAGCTRSILTGERTALNFLQTLSAVATNSRRYAELVSHTNVKLLDTRKTLPGLRVAQKYAVQTGGCHNHRMGLYDAFLIKENHIMACGSITAAIDRARELYPDRTAEVEVENLAELKEAIAARPDVIMLDNFDPNSLSTAVEWLRNQPVSSDTGMKPIMLEASGGIESDTELIEVAETGVDYISIGALTKHCRAIDLSLRFLSSHDQI